MTDSELAKLDRRAASGEIEAAADAARIRQRNDPSGTFLLDHAYSRVQEVWLPRIEYMIADGSQVAWGDDFDEEEDDGYGPPGGYGGGQMDEAREAAKRHADLCLSHARDGKIVAARAAADAACDLETDAIDRRDAWGETSDLLSQALWRVYQKAEELFPGELTAPGELRERVFASYSDEADLDEWLAELDRLSRKR